ncbi:MAG: sulfatase-like hydrolase/transferase, partial [Psychromonas sp.]|nr:sulfatase-like hydrolase/transferase [Psychromonas sp.]
MNMFLKSDKVKFIIFNIFIMILFLFIGNFYLIDLLSAYIRDAHYDRLFVMGVLFFFSSFLITAILFIKKINWIILLLFFLSLFLEYSSRQITGHGFTFNDALLIFKEWRTGGEAFVSFYRLLIIPVVISGLIVALIWWFIRSIKINIAKKKVVVIICLFFIVNLLMYKIMELTNARRDTFPLVYKIPLTLAYAYNNELYVGDRKKIVIPHTKSEIQHIIFIVDESVRGDVQSLNGYKINTTPFLNSLKNKIFNYGIASSGANLSSYSNNLLMTGGLAQYLPDNHQISRRIPTIFEYAKNAGYHTLYLAAQNSRVATGDFLMEQDYDVIDQMYFVLDDKSINQPGYMVDYVALNKLVTYIKKNAGIQTFTYFIKRGSHFLYEERYPPNKKYFTPTLSASDYGKWDKVTRPKFLNSYYNTIRWGVDDFFEQLYGQLQGTKSLIIYTSDHGQNLIDDLRYKQTHGILGKAPVETANVPLFMIPL